MAWIESHQELRNHPKTKKAARLLRVHWAQVIGHLHALWWWAIDNAPDGDLSGYDREELHDATGWDGDTDIIDVFCTCGKAGEAGFLERTEDGRLLIHDWWEYAGKLITKRQQNADRVKEYRARNAHVTHTERVGTPLNSTVQNSTEPLIMAIPADVDAAPLDPAFSRVCQAYHANIGVTTKIISDKLKDNLATYGADWVEEAIGVATAAEKRNLSYVEGILKRWRTEGKTNGRNGNGVAADPYKGAREIK